MERDSEQRLGRQRGKKLLRVWNCQEAPQFAVDVTLVGGGRRDIKGDWGISGFDGWKSSDTTVDRARRGLKEKQCAGRGGAEAGMGGAGLRFGGRRGRG